MSYYQQLEIATETKTATGTETETRVFQVCKSPKQQHTAQIYGRHLLSEQNFLWPQRLKHARVTKAPSIVFTSSTESQSRDVGGSSIKETSQNLSLTVG